MDKREQTAGEKAVRGGKKRKSAWRKWRKESERLNQLILAETKGELMDVNLVPEAARADLEARDARTLGGEE